MAIQKQEPTAKAPWPPNPNNDPQKRTPKPYPVGNSKTESFYSIARDMRVDVNDLVRYNFGTNNPKHINWYLENYVGCVNTDGSGYNYTFYGAKFDGANKATIFIPIANSGGGGGGVQPSPVPTPDPGNPDVHQQSFEYSGEWTLAKKPGTHVLLEAKFGVKGKGMFTMGGGQFEGGAKLSKDKIGIAIAKKLTDDWEVGGQAQFEREFVNNLKKKDGKSLKQKAREAVEVSFKYNPHYKGIFEDLTYEVSLSMGETPLVVKVISPPFGKKLDLTEQLGARETVQVSLEGNAEITFGIGPSPALLAQLGAEAGAAFAIIGAFVGFVGFGAWYAGEAARRGDRKGVISAYVTGYLSRIGLSSAGGGYGSQEQYDLHAIGYADCERDAIKTFNKSAQESCRLLLIALYSLTDPSRSDGERREAMKNMVVATLRKRLREDYNVDY